MAEELNAQQIADAIRANPNGVMTIDNDCWWLKPAKPEDCGDDALERWYDHDGVAHGGSLWTLYEAFAIVAGITVEQP